MHLVAMSRSGAPEQPIPVVPAEAAQAAEAHAGLYGRVGREPPWLGYYAVVEGTCVGVCGFTSPPRDGVVEIAYFTMPGGENRGVATAMARHLIAMSREARPDVIVMARTLPQASASTTILGKLGFQLAGTILHPEDGEVWEWRLP